LFFFYKNSLMEMKKIIKHGRRKTMNVKKSVTVAIGILAVLVTIAGAVLLTVSGIKAVTWVLAAIVFSLSVVAGMLVIGPLATPGLLLAVCIAVCPVGAAVMLMFLGFTAAMVNLGVGLQQKEQNEAQPRPC
jgi:polyferredoxin